MPNTRSQTHHSYVPHTGFSRLHSSFATLRLCLVALLCALLLSACQSSDNGPDTSTTTTSNGGSGNPTNPPVNNQPAFALLSDAASYSLTEGGAISVQLTLARDAGHVLPVTLSLTAATQDEAKNLVGSFSTTTLNASTSQSTANLRLDIAIAPILPQQRNITITATDNTNVKSLTLALNITPVSAPDVYLLAGQSNMEGFSEIQAKDAGPGGADESNPRIRQLNATGNDNGNFSRSADFSNPARNVAFPRFVPAEDPLHESFNPTTQTKEGSRIGLGLSFAKAALENTTQEIILVPTAWAGTGFCNEEYRDLSWNPVQNPNDATQGGTQLFDRALTRINIALEETGGILRGILWHQGEADSIDACAAKYASNLQAMVRAFRTQIREDARGSAARGAEAPIPFVVGTMSRGDDERGEYSIFDDPKTEVDRVHRMVNSLIPWSGLSNHDDLVPPAYACGQGFCIHFGATAYREMGRRYFQSLQSIGQL